jgi:hypothetical protein
VCSRLAIKVIRAVVQGCTSTRIVLHSIALFVFLLAQKITINTSVIICRYIDIVYIQYSNRNKTIISACSCIQSDVVSKLGDTFSQSTLQNLRRNFEQNSFQESRKMLF